MRNYIRKGLQGIILGTALGAAALSSYARGEDAKAEDKIVEKSEDKITEKSENKDGEYWGFNKIYSNNKELKELFLKEPFKKIFSYLAKEYKIPLNFDNFNYENARKILSLVDNASCGRLFVSNKGLNDEEIAEKRCLPEFGREKFGLHEKLIITLYDIPEKFYNKGLEVRVIDLDKKEIVAKLSSDKIEEGSNKRGKLSLSYEAKEEGNYALGVYAAEKYRNSDIAVIKVEKRDDDEF